MQGFLIRPEDLHYLARNNPRVLKTLLIAEWIINTAPPTEEDREYMVQKQIHTQLESERPTL